MTAAVPRKPLKTLILFAVAINLTSMSLAANVARFDWLEYRGLESGANPGPGSYRNPILAGFYPDPSIVRVGPDFYLVNSSFSWFPGIPIWHSRDLVHWRQIGNAIDRPEQLDFQGLGMSRGVFAPDISYHGRRFYIINTCVDCGGNFVITARDPRGPWSNPVWLKDLGGIDPSLFFDDDGSAWIVNNDGPQGKPLYDGHRAIWLRRFDPGTLQASGPPRLIVNGGVDLARKPVWIEGPHLFNKDGVYYLMAAEGGTATAHSEVIFRAGHIEGPYVPAPSAVNPILTQRDLDPARRAPITSAGHADLVKLDNGDWWAVFLATRPYADDLYNIGRETFLLPVTWRDGWPTILPRGTAIPALARAPALAMESAAPTTGNFIARDDFAGATLAPGWVMMRTPQTRWWRLDRGALLLEARPERIGDGKQPSFLARRQQNAEAIVSTAVSFVPAEGESAGLAALQNDEHFLAVVLTRANGRLMLRVSRRAGANDPLEGATVASRPAPAGPIQLRLHARGGLYDFDYALKRGQWRPLAHDVDGTNLSTAKAGGFVGTLIGPFAQSAKGAAPVALKQ
jgi:xylan 1,4-beta-xylosidase